MIHIQKMAPGPPMRIAPDAPTMLPVPTWAAMAVDKRLERASCRRSWLAAAQAEVAEHAAPALAEAAELDRLGAHGEPNAHAEQQDDQDVVGQVVVDGGNDTKQRLFHGIPFFS